MIETDFESELSNSFGHSVFGSRANSLSADIVEQRFSSLEGSPLAETWAISGGFSLLAPDSDLFSVSAPTLLDRVLYANLLLQAQVQSVHQILMPKFPTSVNKCHFITRSAIPH